MAEKQIAAFIQSTPNGKEELGTIEVAPEVIEVIAGIATTEVEGVASTKGSFTSGVVEKFGKKVHSKGIKSTIASDGQLTIDVFCSVKYGFSIPKVAKAVQNTIRQSLYNMAEIQTTEVNIHITSVQFDTVKE